MTSIELYLVHLLEPRFFFFFHYPIFPRIWCVGLYYLNHKQQLLFCACLACDLDFFFFFFSKYSFTTFFIHSSTSFPRLCFSILNHVSHQGFPPTRTRYPLQLVLPFNVSCSLCLFFQLPSFSPPPPHTYLVYCFFFKTTISPIFIMLVTRTPISFSISRTNQPTNSPLLCVSFL